MLSFRQYSSFSFQNTPLLFCFVVCTPPKPRSGINSFFRDILFPFMFRWQQHLFLICLRSSRIQPTQFLLHAQHLKCSLIHTRIGSLTTINISPEQFRVQDPVELRHQHLIRPLKTLLRQVKRNTQEMLVLIKLRSL